MSTTVTYKGQTLTTVENQTKTLNTAGTWVEGDFTLTDVTQGGGWSADGIGQGLEPEGAITYNATTMVESAFNQNGNTRNQSGITDFYAPNLLSVPPSAFKNARHLLTASFPVATEMKTDAFNYAILLNTINVPQVDTINPYSIAHTAVTTLTMPALTIGKVDGLRDNGSLAVADFGKNFTMIQNRCFLNCKVLTTLILRSETVVTLDNTGAFSNTPYASGGAGGDIYVPQALLSTYPTSTNWSTVDGYGTITWKAIEGSQYEDYYADGSEVTA